MSKKKSKDKSQSYLKDLLTYEQAFQQTIHRDEPTETMEFDTERLWNHLPFYIQQISNTVRKPKKIIVNDIGPGLGFVDQGHELFYRFLFNQGADIYHCTLVDEKPVLSKMYNYEDLAKTFRKATVDNKITKDMLKEFPVESYEYIDHERRLEIFEAICSLMPKSEYVRYLNRMDELPRLDSNDISYQDQYYASKKIKSLGLPYNEKHYSKDKHIIEFVSSRIKQGIPNQADTLFLEYNSLRDMCTHDTGLLSDILDYALAVQLKKVHIATLQGDEHSQKIANKLLEIKSLQSLKLKDITVKHIAIDILKNIAIFGRTLESLELERVDTESADLTKFDITDIASALPNLRELSVTGWGLFFDRFFNLDNVPLNKIVFPKLEKLHLQWVASLEETLKILSANPQVKELYLSTEDFTRRKSLLNDVDPAVANSIALEGIPLLSLKKLTFSKCCLPSEAIIFLLQKSPRLKKLIIQNEAGFNFTMLAKIHIPMLTHFAIETDQLEINDLYLFLKVNPSIQSLTIITKKTTLSLPVINKCPEVLNIRKLILNDNDSEEHDINLYHLSPLFEACSKSLKHLKIVCEKIIGSMPLLQLPNLKTYEHFPCVNYDDYIQETRSFMYNIIYASPNLESLDIFRSDSLDDHDPVLFDASFNSFFINQNQLFKKLRSLRLDRIVVEYSTLIKIIRSTERLESVNLSCRLVNWVKLPYDEELYLKSLQKPKLFDLIVEQHSSVDIEKFNLFSDVRHLSVSTVSELRALEGEVPLQSVMRLQWIPYPSLEKLMLENVLIEDTGTLLQQTYPNLLVFEIKNDTEDENLGNALHQLFSGDSLTKLEQGWSYLHLNYIDTRPKCTSYLHMLEANTDNPALDSSANLTNRTTPALKGLNNRHVSKLDQNTSAPNEAIPCQTYFDEPVASDECRHEVYTGMKFENGKVDYIKHIFTPENCVPVNDVQFVTQKELIENYLRLKQDEALNIRVGGAIYLIKPGEWQPFPSCSTIEKLLYINHAVDIVFDPIVSKHYFKLKDNIQTPQKIDLRFIEEIAINQFDPGRKFQPSPRAQEYLDKIKDIRFDANGIVKNETYDLFKQLSAPDLAKIFYLYISNFPDEGEPLTGTFKNDVEVLNAILQQKKGACGHRAFLFEALMTQFGTSCHAVVNDTHAFNEVIFKNAQGQNVKFKFDLGGYPVDINPSPNRLFEEDQSRELDLAEYDEFTEPQPEEKKLIPQIEQVQDYSSSSSSTTIPETPSVQSYPCFDDFLNEQLRKAALFDETKRNILIAIEDDDVCGFHAALLRYYQKSDNEVFCVPDLDAILDKSGKIVDGIAISTKSQLANYVENARSNDVLAVNWSNYNSLHLGHNSIMDDERRIGATNIPAGVVNIGFIKRSDLNKLGEDLTSRFRVYAACPSALLNSPYCDAIETTADISDDTVVIPFYNENWRGNLVGKIGFDDGMMKYLEGELSNAIKNNKKRVIFHNAPWHLEDFRLYYNELIINRTFWANGARVEIPNDFVINKLDKPFELNFQFINLDFNHPSELSYILNKDTLSTFIHGFTLDQRKLRPNNGILGQYAGCDMDVYVTDNLTHNQWAWFLSETKRQSCKVRLHVASHVTLPDSFNQLNVERPLQVIETQSSDITKVIESADLDAAEDYLRQHFPEITYFSVHEQSTFSELMGHLVPDKSEDFVFDFHYSHIYERLKRGETVVLKGNLSEKLRHQLESLFTNDPHLYMNGERHTFTGRLILLTNNSQAIPFVDSAKLDLMRPDMWNQLGQYLDDDNLFNHLQQACEKFESVSHYRFSYAQLKTMLQKLARGNYTNPFAAFFRLLPNKDIVYAKQIWQRLQLKLEKPTTSDDYLDRRKRKFLTQLNSSPYTFIVGSSGVGKSTFLMDSLKDDPSCTVHVGSDKMLEWINAVDGKEQILFLDEANLEFPGVWENLEGIFDIPPGVVVNNKYYPLTDKHKVVFAGNYNSFEGRFQHRIFEKHGNIITFKDLPDFVLRDRIINKAIDKLLPNLPVQNQVANIFLFIYNLVNTKINKEKPLTPRNLKTMCLRLKLYTEKYHQYFLGEDGLQKMALMAAYDEVSTALTKKEKIKFRKSFDTDNFFTNNDRKLIKQKIKSQSLSTDKMVVTKSRQNPLRLIKDGLSLREMKLANSDLHDLYLPGLLFEGGSGIGKSTMIMEQLHQLNFVPAQENNLDVPNRYYVLTPGKRDAMKKKLLQAFHEGAVIVIDEFNSLGLEKELNTLLSGTDFDGNQPDKSGFYIIATQNPVSMKKRPKLSEALLKRMQKVDLKEYTRAELIDIVSILSRNAKYAVKAVDSYIAIRKQEDKNNVIFKSTPRTLFSAAVDYRKSSKRALEDNETTTTLKSKRNKSS